MSRAGWSAGTFRAPKLWKSSSISGPSTTWNPMATQMSTISSSMARNGWTCPRGRARPGSVTSTRSSASARSSRAASSRASRAPSAWATAFFTSFASAPIAGRSSGGSWPSPRRTAFSEPLRPRYLSRNASSASALSTTAISARADSRSSASTARTSLCRGAGCALRQRRELPEGLGVVERQRRQHLAVDLDRRGLQPGHEPAVRQPVRARGRVDADDPEAAELPLLLLAVPVGIGETALDRLASLAIGLAPSTDVPLRRLHRLLVPAACLRAAFRARHAVLLRRSAAVRQQALDRLLVGLVDEGAAAEVPLLLARLVREDVSQEPLVALHLPLRRHLEALCGATAGFHLGHVGSFPFSTSTRASSTCAGPRDGP